MYKDIISIIEKTIQYKFNNDALLAQAFDFEPGDGNDPRSNGILRIVGKRAINYALTVTLMNYYGTNENGSPYKTTIENTVIYDLLDNLTSQDLYRVSVNVLGLTEYVSSFEGGELVYDDPTIDEKRKYCNEQMATIYEEVKRTKMPHEYYVDGTEDYVNMKYDLINKTKKVVLEGK